tara:strand:- start:8 stop:553 length:546 start_codon:yes stop_codon:yes gene_type:complete
VGQEEVVAVFAVENEGEVPVEVLKLSVSCNCLVAEMEDKVLDPGESGEVRLVFTVGNRKGKQKRVLEVVTDENPEEVTRLTMTTEVPELGVIRPLVLLWREGETEERSVRLEMMDGVSWALVPPSKELPFSVEVAPPQEGKPITLIVTPLDWEPPLREEIQVMFSNGAGLTQTKFVRLMVR